MTDKWKQIDRDSVSRFAWFDCENCTMAFVCSCGRHVTLIEERSAVCECGRRFQLVVRAEELIKENTDD